MSGGWSPPPRRSAPSIKPLAPTRSRRQRATDRLIGALILCLYVGAIVALASYLSGK